MKKIAITRDKIVHSVALAAFAISVSAAGVAHAQQGQGSMPGQGGMQGGDATTPGTQAPRTGQDQRYQQQRDQLKKGSDMDRRGEDSSSGDRSGTGSGTGMGSGSGTGSGSGSGGSSGGGSSGGGSGGGGGGG